MKPKFNVAIAAATLLLISTACFFGGGSDEGEASDQAAAIVNQIPTTNEPAPIEEVSMTVWPRGPMLTVKSGVPSTCSRFKSSKIVSESGTDVAIAVNNSVPADPQGLPCNPALGSHTSMLELTGDYRSCQAYRPVVNGVPFDIQAQHPTKTCDQLDVPTPAPVVADFPGTRHQVRVGGTFSISNRADLKLERIVEDTRCAFRTGCFSQEVVVAEVTVIHRTVQENHTLELDTGFDDRPFLSVNDQTVRFIGLEPFPTDAVPVPQQESYVATFVVN